MTEKTKVCEMERKKIPELLLGLSVSLVFLALHFFLFFQNVFDFRYFVSCYNFVLRELFLLFLDCNGPFVE